jgi:hypothetical protein
MLRAERSLTPLPHGIPPRRGGLMRPLRVALLILGALAPLVVAPLLLASWAEPLPSSNPVGTCLLRGRGFNHRLHGRPLPSRPARAWYRRRQCGVERALLEASTGLGHSIDRDRPGTLFAVAAPPLEAPVLAAAPIQRPGMGADPAFAHCRYLLHCALLN